MTATDYDFRLTRNQIIESAFSKIGVLAVGEVLSGEQLTQGSRELDLLVKELQNDHIFLWTEVKQQVQLTAQTNYVSLPTDTPIDFIRDGYWKKDINNDELKLYQVSKEVFYRELASRFTVTNTGSPEYFYFDATENKCYFLPTPSSNSYFTYLGIKRAKDWEASSDKGEFPARWQKALIYLLAADLSDDYRIPQSEKQLLAQSAAIYVQRAKNGDRDGEDCLIMGGGFYVKRTAGRSLIRRHYWR